MKLLLHADAVSGVFPYALELAGALQRAGVRVVLATEGAPLHPDQRRAVQAVPGITHRESSTRLEWMDDPWEDVARAGQWLLALERRERPDLLGWLPEPELAAWLGRAALFAHPARYQPFGLAVLEAALAGCALVLGDIESLRETWDGAALFVPPDDDAALLGAVRALAGDARARETFAAAARARALGLGPDRMAERYLSLYGWLLGGGREVRARGSPSGEAHRPAQRRRAALAACLARWGRVSSGPDPGARSARERP